MKMTTSVIAVLGPLATVLARFASRFARCKAIVPIANVDKALYAIYISLADFHFTSINVDNVPQGTQHHVGWQASDGIFVLAESIYRRYFFVFAGSIDRRFILDCPIVFDDDVGVLFILDSVARIETTNVQPFFQRLLSWSSSRDTR